MRQQERRKRWPILAGLGLAGGAFWWLTGGAAPTADGAEDEPSAVREPPRAITRERSEGPSEPRLAERAAISGTVTDARGRPIAGALVCAVADSKRLGVAELRRPSCSSTARDGHYRIAGLFGVRQRVHASAPGFVPTMYARGEGAARRDTIDLRPGTEVRDVDVTLKGGGVEIRGVVKDLSGGVIEGAQLQAGDAFGLSGADGAFSLWVAPGEVYMGAYADGYATGFDHGTAPGHVFEVFLTPEAVLIGKVVRAGDGTPIEGARVAAVGRGKSIEDTAYTDSAGQFRIDGLEPGAYKARAEADDAVGMAEEQVILGIGETSRPIVVTAHPAFSVEGRIVVEGGASCDRGWIRLQDRAHGRDGWGEPEGDGQVVIRGLLPGAYEVDVQCDGRVPAERYASITIADRSVSGLTWAVTRGGTIRGVVVDSTGGPVAQIGVSADPRPDPGDPRAQRTNAWGVTTDEAGRFELTGLLPAIYDVSLNAWDPPRATPPGPIAVTLPRGQDVEGLRIALPATGEVRGTVRDAQGRPVRRAIVELSDRVRSHHASAGDDGAFVFGHVAAGAYRVVARRLGDESMRAPGTSDDDVQGEKVTVQVGETAAVELVVESVAGALRGTVRDADGAPVVDAFVEATRESDSAARAAGGAAREGRWGSFWQTPHMTDQEGRFTLSQLPAGKYTVRAYRRGGGEGIREHVELGGDVALTIAETGRMAGTVRVRGGSPPEEFTVRIEDEATGFRRDDSFFRTGGAWSLPEVPAGTYKVRVSAGAGTAEVEATMRAGEDSADVRVELAPKITIRGTVVDLDGEPLSGMSIHVQGAGTWASEDGERSNITDARGRYEIAGAPTGAIRVSVWPQGYSSSEYGWAEVPVRIDDGATSVELPPIEVARRRVKDGEAVGDVGYAIRESEPGADPRAARLIVAVVRPGGPASAAGLLVGDEITSVDGRDVTGPRAYLHRALTRARQGTSINLGLARGASVELVVGAPP